MSAGIFFSGIIDLLIEGGADITAENVYRESPGFVLFLRDVFEVFLKHEMDNTGQMGSQSVSFCNEA